MSQVEIKQSKYIKDSKEKQVFEVIAVLYLLSYFVLPQYFGIPTPFFDFTMLRITLLLLIVMIIGNYHRKKEFLDSLDYSAIFAWLPYGFVTLYTMILRVDISAFLNTFLEFVEMVLVFYVIKNTLGIKKSMKYILIFLYILTVLGLIEYFTGKNLFFYLKTIQISNVVTKVRSGQIRIMGPCVHSIGYGLLLITALPFAVYDFDKNEINVTKRICLVVLMLINVLFTGSRASLAIFGVELVLLFLFSTKETKKRNLLFGLFLFSFLGLFLILGQNTGAGRYIMLQITSVIDEVFGTSFATAYGADNVWLQLSSDYRDELPYIFTLDWLNPLLGQGRNRHISVEIHGVAIESIDNFYVAEYIRYAYPGLITFLFFLLYHTIKIVKKAFQYKDSFCFAFAIGSICYLGAIITVDSLGTFKYLYLLFAFALVWISENDKQTVVPKKLKKSKYLKRQ